MSGQPGVRPEIELAWRRAQLAGLDPGVEVRGSVLSDIDRRSRLIVAAEPVLDRMAQDLVDTRFSVLLADSASVIVDRRYGQRSLTGALDRVMAVPGSHYTEAVSGSNALATAYELRQPIAVTGPEHYLEALKQFSCFGAPIVHPATRRLEGVLDVTGHVDDATELLPPFLMRAVRDIEQHLLNGARVAEQRMLAAFQAQAAHRPHPVVVLSDDVLLANSRAVDLLHASDHAKLRELAIDAPRSGSVSAVLVLDGGAAAASRRRDRPRRRAGAHLRRTRYRPQRPGLPDRRRGRLGAGGPRRARRRYRCVDPAGQARRHLRQPRLVMVTGEVSDQPAELAALLARCPVRRELAPLRLRAESFGEIVRDLMQEDPAARPQADADGAAYPRGPSVAGERPRAAGRPVGRGAGPPQR